MHAARSLRSGIVYHRFVEDSNMTEYRVFVKKVMALEPYASARRVFWIMDNGSSHRGSKGDERLRRRWPTIIPVHTPVHASWLNQVEIYFSVVQRKVLTPNDLPSLAKLRDRLLRFQQQYEQVARPFQWKFTRANLAALLTKLKDHNRELAAVA